MTENQRAIYILLCMTGRVNEATEYRKRCEEDKQ